MGWFLPPLRTCSAPRTVPPMRCMFGTEKQRNWLGNEVPSLPTLCVNQKSKIGVLLFRHIKLGFFYLGMLL